MGDIATPAGFCARGWRINAVAGPVSSTALSWADVDALVVDVDPHHVAAQALEQVEHRRESRVLDDDAVAEVQHHAGDPIEGVERPVDDRDRLRRERPRRL